MGRQRNRPQMKEQEYSPEEELDEIETRSLSDREFRVIIIRILKSMKGHRNHKKGPEVKNAISEINNKTGRNKH